MDERPRFFPLLIGLVAMAFAAPALAQADGDDAGYRQYEETAVAKAKTDKPAEQVEREAA